MKKRNLSELRFLRQFRNALYTFLVLGFAACGSDDSRLRQRAQIEGEETAKKSIEVENTNREKRVQEMEADLEKRHRFYDALVGVFKGDYPKILSSGETLQAQVTIKKLKPYYKPERLRTIEEVQVDINDLSLEIDYVIKGSSFSTLCSFKNVHPDLRNGLMVFPSEECSRSVQLSFGEKGEEISGKIFKAETLQVPVIKVDERWKFTGDSLSYELKR